MAYTEWGTDGSCRKERIVTVKKSEKGICTYCGKSKNVTKDHVIPKCLFPSRLLPSFMPTVPACGDCNNEKSKHEAYLRDMLVAESDNGENETVKLIARGKMRRSVDSNRSDVIRAAKTKGAFQPVYSRGDYLGPAIVFPLDDARIHHIFSLIVRGLYFTLTRHHLPQDCAFAARRVTPDQFNVHRQVLDRIGYNGPFKLHDDVFSCMFIYGGEKKPAFSQWWLWFYRHICVTVLTDTPLSMAKLDREIRNASEDGGIVRVP